ncbi:unnamed protein product [Paramecium sonneborni]|uniref:MORN repeat protein n=1 Tax=Paramecium sonneborni TaxID=65129 RepID=A0A8S1RPI7_9CILI|nr:unnamed protein product [Paramecium sonneborni]
MYCKENEQKYRQIGGGSYDKEGNQIKIGNWVELDENCQVTYKGEYNIKGMKVSRWDIMYCEYNKLEYKQMQIQYKKKKYIEVVDHMIRKEIRQRLEYGLIWMNGFLHHYKSFIKVNIICLV